MSRIAVVVSNPCVSDARVLKMAYAARDAGHEVHVFATLGQGAQPYQVVEGITYNRVEWNPSQLMASRGLAGVLARVARRPVVLACKVLSQYTKYSLFAEVFAAQIASVKPDIIHAHDLVCLPAGAAAARTCGARLVYDAHELEVHRNPPLPFYRKWFVGAIEKRHGQKADAIITVGRKVGEVLSRHIGRDDINVLYNAPLREPCASTLRRDLQLPASVPLLLYVGKVTMGRGVGELLELLPKMPGVFFAAVGPSDLGTSQELRKMADMQGLADRFRILPPVPHEQVVSYIAGATVGIISVEPVTLSYRYCMPNKLFELAFAGVPILSNELDEIKEFLAELGIGETTDFELTHQLPHAIYRMAMSPTKYVASPEAIERLEQAYSWPAQTAKLRLIYERVMASAPRQMSR